MTKLTLWMLGKIFIGAASLKLLSGQVEIVAGAGATLSMRFISYLNFLALTSISLSVLNFLPVPILDGGHLLHLVIEGLTGKPLSLRVQLIAFRIGKVFLLLLMLVAFLMI